MTTTVDEAAKTASLQPELQPLIEREMAGISVIDTAIAHASPDYVVMFRSARNGKQANVEQMATLIRMQDGTPDERGGVRKALMKMQAGVTARLSSTMTLHAMRAGEIELVAFYSEAVARLDGLASRALRKTLGRALVHTHLLTAHIAKRTGSDAEARLLPAPLGAYFAGPEPRACMRCHLDRPGTSRALLRTDPHPYTYLCAACHDEVPGEFPPDLAMQMERWPREVREARVLEHGLGLVSRLNAIGRVLHLLAGLDPDVPAPAAERAVIVPAMTPTPAPAPEERPGKVTIEKGEGAEADYVDRLFSPRQVWTDW